MWIAWRDEGNCPIIFWANPATYWRNSCTMMAAFRVARYHRGCNTMSDRLLVYRHPNLVVAIVTVRELRFCR
jgi:hypothetical protein